MLSPIDFDDINSRATAFAAHLAEQQDEIAHSLADYECYEVVLDEIQRCREFLDNLPINREYFQYCIGGVTTFLPLNQPLYATVCFGVVPSLMSSDVSIRPPTAMHRHYEKLWRAAGFHRFFPNLNVYYAEKEAFIAERCSRTDAVIFTGTPENATKVRRHFLRKCLFILNGAGHNPLVVTPDANLESAIDSAARVVLYNQGQDCAGPNSILVSRSIADDFMNTLSARLRSLEARVGPYRNRLNVVGPNSDPDHSLKIANLFGEHREHCVYGGDINPITGMIRPTVFLKELALGGNFREFFAPVFFIQPYAEDKELSLYFEDPRYPPHAMYVSLFGSSSYVESLIHRGLHTAESVLRDTDLHEAEKGYLPYGGLGPSASCLFVNGNRVCGATLPQRDLYEYLVKPRIAELGNARQLG